jgi:nitrate/TMAO reductase-like tetraheme cytochrome c subunit
MPDSDSKKPRSSRPKIPKPNIPKPKMPKLKMPKIKFSFRMSDLQDPKKRFALTMYAGAAVIGVLLLTAVAVPVLSNPVFCGYTCHENTPEYFAWQKSSHSQVPCYGCHSDVGVVNLMKEKILVGLPTVFKKFAGHESPVNANSEASLEMPSEACERCHDMDHLKLTPSRGIIMNHAAHKAKGIRCPICHNRVAHRLVNNQSPDGFRYDAGERQDHHYLEGLNMREGCFRCHTRKDTALREEMPEVRDAPTKCSTCHNSDFPLPPGHGADWRTNHRLVVQEKGVDFCLKCHNKEEFCAQCHDLQSLNQLQQQIQQQIQQQMIQQQYKPPVKPKPAKRAK